MSTKIGDMAIYLSANTSPLAKDLAAASKMIGGFAVGVKDKISSLASGFASLSKEMVAIAGGNLLASGIKSAAAGLGGMVSESVSLAAEMEKNVGAFEVLTGSAEKTRELMKDIRDFAAASPLSLKQSTDQVKKLIAAGIAPDQAVPTLSRLSDAAMGDPAIVERLAYAYGQVNAAGRLYGTELKQFTETGIPLINELAKVMGKPRDQIKHLVEDGRVGFYELQLAIKSLTDKGGIYFGQSDKYAETLAGKWDKAKDAIEDLKRSFGVALVEGLGLKSAADDAGNFAESLKPMIERLKPIIRFVGELGRGFANLAAEGGKAAFEIGDRLLTKLGAKFPEFVKGIKGAVDSLKNFSIDGFDVENLAESIGNAIVDGLNFARSAWDGFVDSFVEPIGAVIKNVWNISNDLTAKAIQAKDLIDGGNRYETFAKAQEYEKRISRIMGQYGITREAATEYDAFDTAKKTRQGQIPGDLKKITSEIDSAIAKKDAGANAAARQKLEDLLKNDAIYIESLEKKMDSAKGVIDPSSYIGKQLRKQQREMEAYQNWQDSELAKLFKGPAGDRFSPLRPDLEPRLSELSTKLEERFIDPLVKFANDVTDLDKIKAAGRIDSRAYALAYSELVGELARNNHLGPTQLAPGLELGSSQLASVIAQASAGGEANSVEGILKSIKLIQDQQLTAARELVNQGKQPPVVFHPSP